ncbi:hypothetical protein A9Q97_00960 [Rhodospirillales bacterium 47_12_T64]|nr:hypothetical protein A9Q97_00960 [Rhodospirillales bacterium 47_12_T64]
MSDDKLKSEGGKPAKRKPAVSKAAEKKSAATSKTTPTVNKKAVTSSKTSAPTSVANRKTKTKADKSVTAKASLAKNTDKKITKSSQAPKMTTKQTDTLKSLKEVDTQTSPSKDKDQKKTTKILTAKSETETVNRPRKSKSFTKMATVAAVLFLGVLFVFLKGNDPESVEEQSASKSPTVQVEAPNLNASSPYGMRVEQLKEIENLLASLNLDPGNIDGDIDHDAVAAISLFQEISGLQVDGRPTPDLLVDLKAVEELLKIE